MSRGLGRIERRILGILDDSPAPLRAVEIARHIDASFFGRPLPAVTASVRRALGRLRQKKLVMRFGKKWFLPLPKTGAALRADRLTRLLDMLGSDHGGEVLNAARAIERERKRLGKTWSDLIR